MTPEPVADDRARVVAEVLEAHPYKPSLARGIERCGCDASAVGQPGWWRGHVAAAVNAALPATNTGGLAERTTSTARGGLEVPEAQAQTTVPAPSATVLTQRAAADPRIEAIRALRPSTDVTRLSGTQAEREDEIARLNYRRAINDVVAKLTASDSERALRATLGDQPRADLSVSDEPVGVMWPPPERLGL